MNRRSFLSSLVAAATPWLPEIDTKRVYSFIRRPIRRPMSIRDRIHQPFHDTMIMTLDERVSFSFDGLFSKCGDEGDSESSLISGDEALEEFDHLNPPPTPDQVARWDARMARYRAKRGS